MKGLTHHKLTIWVNSLFLSFFVLVLNGKGFGNSYTSNTPNTSNKSDTKVKKEVIGGDFILTDHMGQPFKLIDQRGKLVVIFFGYTYCPDICPTELSSLARVLNSFDKKVCLQENSKGNSKDNQHDNLKCSKKLNRVVPLFISIDPNRDTPEKLKQYVSFYSPQLIGLTGTQEQIDVVADAYHVQRQIHLHHASDDNYRVDHSANLYVVSGKGKLVNIIPFGLPLEHMQQVIEMELSKLD